MNLTAYLFPTVKEHAGGGGGIATMFQVMQAQSHVFYMITYPFITEQVVFPYERFQLMSIG